MCAPRPVILSQTTRPAYRDLRIYYKNIKGLRTKTKSFYSAVLTCEYDIIAITETWLNDSILHSELISHVYSVYRCDRKYAERSDTRGGE